MPLEIINIISINAPITKVWDALVNPEITRLYMFGCDAISDWKVGSPLLWNGSHEGKEMTFVKGKIVIIEPNKILKFTVIDPNAPYPDIPENYLNVTYELKEENGATNLKVTQDGFEGAADAENRYKHGYNNGEGWNPILSQIKKIVEG